MRGTRHLGEAAAAAWWARWLRRQWRPRAWLFSVLLVAGVALVQLALGRGGIMVWTNSYAGELLRIDLPWGGHFGPWSPPSWFYWFPPGSLIGGPDSGPSSPLFGPAVWYVLPVWCFVRARRAATSGLWQELENSSVSAYRLIVAQSVASVAPVALAAFVVAIAAELALTHGLFGQTWLEHAPYWAVLAVAQALLGSSCGCTAAARPGAGLPSFILMLMTLTVLTAASGLATGGALLAAGAAAGCAFCLAAIRSGPSDAPGRPPAR